MAVPGRGKPSAAHALVWCILVLLQPANSLSFLNANAAAAQSFMVSNATAGAEAAATAHGAAAKSVPGIALRVIIEEGAPGDISAPDAVEKLSLHMTNPATRDNGFKAFLKKYKVSETVQLHRLVPAAESTAFANVAAEPSPTQQAVAFHGMDPATANGAAPTLRSDTFSAPAIAPLAHLLNSTGGQWASVPTAAAPAAAMAASPAAAAPGIPAFSAAPSGAPMFGVGPSPSGAPMMFAPGVSPAPAPGPAVIAAGAAPLGMQPVPGAPILPATTMTTTMSLLTGIESTTVQLEAHEKAYGLRLRDINKLAGSTPAWDPESPEPKAFHVKKPRLIRSGVRCLSQEMKLQTQPTVALCADTAANYNAVYFTYGDSAVAGECNVEYTSNEWCTEGFLAASFSFYKLEDFMVRVIPARFGIQCDSMTTDLGTYETAEECGKWATIAGNSYFAFGKRDAAGKCVTGPPCTVTTTETGNLTQHPACKVALKFGDFDLFEIDQVPGAPPAQHEPFHMPPVGKLPYACLGDHCTT